MVKLPLKMRVIQWFSMVNSASAEDVLRNLQWEYASERQLCAKSLTHMLQTMKAVGIVRVSNVEVLGETDALPRYVLTEYGFTRMKYIPR